MLCGVHSLSLSLSLSLSFLFQGLDLLTNIQRGHVYGDVSGWSLSRRRQLGVHLLHKAYQSYRLHTPQQIYQTDL